MEKPEPIGPPHEDHFSPIMGGVAVVGLVIFFGLIIFSRREDPVGAHHPAVGKPLEGLNLVPLGREGPAKQLDGVTGYVTMINYWGPWCPHCKVEMPHLLKLEEELRESGDFQLLLVSCPAGPTNLEQHTSQTNAYLSRIKSEVLAWYDPDQASRKSLMRSADLDGFGYPTTVILDRQGKIRGLWNGFAGGEEVEMERVARELLAEK